ncbi:MAG: hypothetical protein FWH55_08290 [Oscillospiraceae bacterium]|nr:hypothetical protein [Oscillospiraceae bacterium]
MEPVTAEQAAKAAEGLNFEKVWAALMEDREQMRISQRENDKLIKELHKSVGGLGNSLGRFMEDMFSAELYKKFRDIGFTFTKQAERVTFSDNTQVIAEIDLLLENGEYVMLVEIKTNLSIDDVDRHLEKMEIIRGYMDARGDSRKIIGTVAGGIVTGDLLKYAHRAGLYVVIQSGDAVKIADMPKNFKAREY